MATVQVEAEVVVDEEAVDMVVVEAETAVSTIQTDIHVVGV
jgi:hypothetical protein